jgi:hypothetical protein
MRAEIHEADLEVLRRLHAGGPIPRASVELVGRLSERVRPFGSKPLGTHMVALCDVLAGSGGSEDEESGLPPLREGGIERDHPPEDRGPAGAIRARNRRAANSQSAAST